MVLDLALDGAGSLLVAWYDAGDYRCTILDTETLEPRKTFSLFQQERKEAEVIVHGNYAGQEYSYNTWAYDQIQALPGEEFILFLGDTQFWLFVETREGWQQQCTAPLGEDLRYRAGPYVTAAWNGEKLAIGHTDPWVSGLTLWVYDGTGELLFNGTYETSLTDISDTEGYRHSGSVQLMEGKELRLGWDG